MNKTNNKQLSKANIMENNKINDVYKFKLINNTKNPACKWKDKKNHFKKTPSFNYGIPTGIVNNIFVLDLDFYKLDVDGLLANPFIQLYGEQPEFDTFTVASPSGGLHYYFTYDEDIKQTSNAKLEIDTRCDGGYIVGPGSKIDGNEYKIINDTDINPLPDGLKTWMLENLYGKTKKEVTSKPHITINSSESLYTYSFTDALLRRIFDKLPEEYWITYQATDGEPSFLIWTTACKILKCHDLWDEYNMEHDGYDLDKNIQVWNGCNVNIDCVANILRHSTFSNADKLIDYHKFQPVIENEIEADVAFTREKLGYDFFDKDIPRATIGVDSVLIELQNMKDKLQRTRNYPGCKRWTDEEFASHVEEKLQRHHDKLLKRLPPLTEYRNYFVKSDTGTGKTTSFSHYIKRNKLKFLSIVSRKTLGEDQYNKMSEMGIKCQYYEHEGLQYDSRNSMVCQIDSLAYKYALGFGMDWSETVVYLDEYNSLIRHLVRSSTMDDKRSRVYDLFVHILNNCKQVICTDADISDTSLMFMGLNKIDKEFEYHQNLYRHNNKIQAEEIVNYDDLIDKLNKTPKWLCPTDSYANALILAKEFPDAVVITKDTLTLPDFEAHDRIIYSPKVTYGIDSTMEREVFVCYHEKSITPTEMVQQICRCRNIVKLNYFFMRKKFRGKSVSFDEVKLQLLNDNVCGCRFFEHDYGGKYSDAYFTLLSRFEYDNKCYQSNPYAHFKAIIKQRGFIDTDVYRKSNKGCIADDAKALKQEQYENFNINDERFDKTQEILKVPEELADDYKEYFLNPNKLSKHFAICNFFFKDTLQVFNDFDKKTREFNMKKIKNNKAKCKFLKDLKDQAGCPAMFDINVKNGYSKNSATRWQNDYKVIFNSSKTDIDFTDPYSLQKTIVSCYKSLFGSKCVLSKRLYTKTDRKKYEFKFDEDILKRDKELFEFRKVK
eukprot:COSAG01_NODE_2206_length_8170_cov_70.537108_2_plen_945_part_00